MTNAAKKTFRVQVNAVDFGEITATDAFQACEMAAQMAGYKSVADMAERTGEESQMTVKEVGAAGPVTH